MAQSDSNTWNFRVLLGQGAFVDIVRQIASPRLVLPYLYVALGAPVFLAGLLLPLVQVSKLVSQVVFTPFLRAGAQRKWYMVLCFVTVASALAIIGLAARSSSDAGLVAVFLLAGTLIGLAQGFNALLHQDLLGRALSPPSRKTLLYMQTAFGGALTVAIAWACLLYFETADPLDGHFALLWAAVVVVVLAAVLAASLREPKPPAGPAQNPAQDLDEATRGQGPSYKETLLQGFGLIARVPWFRRFLLLRSLILAVELAIPFYAVHAASFHGDSGSSLNSFVIASSLGVIVGGPFWRFFGGKDFWQAMLWGSAIAALGGGLAIAIESFPSLEGQASYAAVFFLVALATQGVKINRKLYMVERAPDSERPTFIAVANAVVGSLGVLLAFVLGSLAHLQDVSWPIFAIVALNLLAFGCALRFREPRRAP